MVELQSPISSVKLSIGPFEIILTNHSKVQLAEAIGDILEAIESNSERVLTLVQKLGAAQTGPLRSIKTGSSSTGTGGLSLTEFVKRVNVKKGTDTVLAVAYYLFKERGVNVLNTRDLVGAWEEARLPKLTNPSDTLNTLIGTGKMREATEKEGIKGFTITQTGESEVEEWTANTN